MHDEVAQSHILTTDSFQTSTNAGGDQGGVMVGSVTDETNEGLLKVATRNGCDLDFNRDSCASGMSCRVLSPSRHGGKRKVNSLHIYLYSYSDFLLHLGFT